MSQKETEPTASPAADFDQRALDIIDAWEAGEYLHPVQKKAALQVAIRDALASPAATDEEVARVVKRLTSGNVERTIANEALRRAAEVAEDYADHYLGGSEGLAAAILALIKEPGHE